jgi:hypothetical protein
MKTLKYEEVLRNEYRDLAEARASNRILSVAGEAEAGAAGEQLAKE